MLMGISEVIADPKLSSKLHFINSDETFFGVLQSWVEMETGQSLRVQLIVVASLADWQSLSFPAMPAFRNRTQ
jgi:alkyl hydroperoxide reductase subunit AhpF